MKFTAASLRSRVALTVVLLALCALLGSQTAPREQVGPLPGGGFLLNSGWRLEPVGKQIPLDTLPLSTAVTPDGKYMLVLNCGYKPPSISVIEMASGSLKSTTSVPDAWLGMTISPRGDRVYTSGGQRASIFEFSLQDGVLKQTREFPASPGPTRAAHDFIGDVTFAPDGHLLYAADLYNDAVIVVNPQSGTVIQRIKTKRRPYRILFHPDGKSFFVSHWADGTVGQYDTASGNPMGPATRIGAHPTDLLWRAGAPEQPEEGKPPYTARLFVAAANTNNVYAVGVTPDKELSVVESINVSMTPRQPLGMTPSGLALSADKKRLFVACSDANAVAVVDVSTDRSRVEGFIPVGWYPTAVRALPSGGLVAINGKGGRSYPNPAGPSPRVGESPVHKGIEAEQYVGHMQTGTASWIDSFTPEQLAQWSRQALSNTPYRDSNLDESSPLPPIQHVLYIVKENRTYDQVLGDIKEGNGDSGLTLFGENITPNLHKIAREFVLLDNFYVNADVSADGHNWSTAAIAPDYVNKLWPSNYSGRKSTYDFEEQDPASLPPAGYLWTNANAAGLSIRNFGYMANNKAGAKTGEEQISSVHDPILAKYTNRFYRSFDLDYPDVERANVFLKELADYERNNSMPRLMVMRLGNDHTNGTAPGKLSPLSYAADNDQAVGMIVEGISKSKFWTNTAIFIVEDDAQNGPDHVDSHRSPAFVISPYIKRHNVDSSMYNTTSMLRTMEFLLGLKPMTHFDAGARPIVAPFQQTADATPYNLEKPRISLTDRNPENAPGAKESAKMDFAEADDIDEDKLNDILWRAIRKDTPPPPTRSYFGK
jgi:YVTN family beta-propeller protein